MKTELSLYLKRGSPKWLAVVGAWNQGIDAHLEAFTRSRFVPDDTYGNDTFHIHPAELSTLIRRLSESSNEVAQDLAKDLHAKAQLDTFTAAYIQCALWAEMDNADDSGGESLDANYTADDIAADTLAAIVADCQAFQADNAKWLDGADLSQAGHDFWLTRNGHGCGFWDGGWPDDAGKAMTEYSKHAGGVYLYVGDDDQIHA
jgi:hypothetical protein